VKISQIIRFLQDVHDNHGDLPLQSITGFWIEDVGGGRRVVPVAGNGNSVQALIDAMEERA
jgi:hypothetical protein